MHFVLPPTSRDAKGFRLETLRDGRGGPGSDAQEAVVGDCGSGSLTHLSGAPLRAHSGTFQTVSPRPARGGQRART